LNGIKDLSGAYGVLTPLKLALADVKFEANRPNSLDGK
jgi:hypothetical protein